MRTIALGRIVLIGGGVRCGKSAFALSRALEAPPPRTFIATAERLDREMDRRAETHRKERGSAFETIEEPLNLDGALDRCAESRVVVVDCLTLWLSNRLLAEEPPESTVSQLEKVLHRADRARHDTIFVTNEVGMGVVPETRLGRDFRDLAGTAHQSAARVASEIYLGALGVVVRLHPSPVEVLARKSSN